MLTAYLNAVMARATLDKQPDNTFHGENTGFEAHKLADSLLQEMPCPE